MKVYALFIVRDDGEGYTNELLSIWTTKDKAEIEKEKQYEEFSPYYKPQFEIDEYELDEGEFK